MTFDVDSLEVEKQLIHNALGGSTDAFSELVLRHQGAVRAYVARYVWSRDGVADVAQESFIAAHRGLASYGGQAPFRMWLLGIARREVATFLREQIRRQAHSGIERVVTEWQTEWVQADEVSMQDREQEMAALRECLRTLSKDNARLVTAFYFKAQTSGEIARQLGRQESAVRMALLRLRKGLRACVDRRLAAGNA